MRLITKYDFEITKDIFIKDLNRLTNQIWKLIPMRENQENWKAQLNSVLLEITGLYEIFQQNSSFLILLSKLEGLNTMEIEFESYRKAVFEAITLLRGLKDNV